jgi:Na+/proline symporter
MKTSKLILYGFLLWLSVFAISFILYPVRQNQPIYFETLITIALVLFTTLFSIFFFKQTTDHYFKKGLIAGFLWMAINLIIDLPLFSFGPMKMPLLNYFEDIGFTYFVIPIIVAGMGWVLEKKQASIQ